MAFTLCPHTPWQLQRYAETLGSAYPLLAASAAARRAAAAAIAALPQHPDPRLHAAAVDKVLVEAFFAPTPRLLLLALALQRVCSGELGSGELGSWAAAPRAAPLPPAAPPPPPPLLPACAPAVTSWLRWRLVCRAQQQ